MPSQAQPVVAQPSASVLVIRDHGGKLEVLMQERPTTMAFAAGAYVFPGGKVDPSDYNEGLWSPMIGRKISADDPYKIAVVRELYEEAGLLLGNASSSAAPRHASAEEIATILNKEAFRVSLGSLIPFAHWVTPEMISRRFDTIFYVVEAPVGQKIGADGRETMKSMWVSPHEILQAWQEDSVPLMFPTRLNLMKLARSTSVSEALTVAASIPLYRVLPTLEKVLGVRKLTIPKAAGYGVTEMSHRELKVETVRKSTKS